MGHSRMTPNDRWNDIPDNESHMHAMMAAPKPVSNLGYAHGRGLSQKQITEKPGNVVFSSKGAGMVFRERTLNKIPREITEKLTNARGGIAYDHYG
jgi:hypothetical protein